MATEAENTQISGLSRAVHKSRYALQNKCILRSPPPFFLILWLRSRHFQHQ